MRRAALDCASDSVAGRPAVDTLARTRGRKPDMSNSLKIGDHVTWNSEVGRVGGTIEIGRAHVRTPVPNAHLVCRLLLLKKKVVILYINIKTHAILVIHQYGIAE